MTHTEEDYDKLYAEWRVKNEACNKAYAITIPKLEELVSDLKRVNEHLTKRNSELTKENDVLRKTLREYQLRT